RELAGDETKGIRRAAIAPSSVRIQHVLRRVTARVAKASNASPERTLCGHRPSCRLIAANRSGSQIPFENPTETLFLLAEDCTRSQTGFGTSNRAMSKTSDNENIFAPVKRRPPYFVLAVLAAFLVMMFCTTFPDQLILFPSTQYVDAHGATRETIPFHNGKLEIWTARSHLAKQRDHVDIYVVRFYANPDRADRWAALDAESFGERAVEVWGVNYPGFGGSTGPARLKRMGDAGVAAFDAIKTRGDAKPIYVFGASIGSAVALHVAANRDV